MLNVQLLPEVIVLNSIGYSFQLQSPTTDDKYKHFVYYT